MSTDAEKYMTSLNTANISAADPRLDSGTTQALAEELREYTAMKYAGDCKCGKCQLVPRALVERIYHTLNSIPGLAQAPPEPWRVLLEELKPFVGRGMVARE